MPQKTFTVRSPVTGEAVGEHRLNREEDVDAALASSRKTFESFRKLPLGKRAALMKKGAGAVVDMTDEIVEAITTETGKKRLEAINHEVFFIAELFHYYGKNLKRFLAPVKVPTPLYFPYRRSYYQFHPRGVVLVIAPWNYPFFLAMAPLVTAVAAGNSAILKPASQTPGTGEICARVFRKAGFPKDLVQTLTGSGSVTGELLLKHREVDMYFFTGSTEVGREVYKTAAKRLKPCTVELGGNDPLIILRSADLDRAAVAAVFAGYSNAGQTCIGTERVYVEAPVYDDFVKKVRELTKKIVAGPGQGPMEMGPMITKGQLDIVNRQLKEAVGHGAKTTQGKVKGDSTRYIPATCLTGVPPDTELMTEETFGPLLPIVKVKDWKEAVKLANRTRYGLSSAVFGKTGGDTQRTVDGIEAGSVTVNDVMTAPATPHLPFGGVKDSGIGVYHGPEGLRSFCRIQSVMENRRHKKKREFYWYPYEASDYDLVKGGMRFLFGHGIGNRMSGMKQGVKMFLKLL